MLDIGSLSVQLGGRWVLREVNLRVDGGELVGLIGPNGAGKTTLLRAVLGVLRQASGTISVAGRAHV